MAFTNPWGEPTRRGFACMMLQGGCSFLYVLRVSLSIMSLCRAQLLVWVSDVLATHTVIQGTGTLGHTACSGMQQLLKL